MGCEAHLRIQRSRILTLNYSPFEWVSKQDIYIVILRYIFILNKYVFNIDKILGFSSEKKRNITTSVTGVRMRIPEWDAHLGIRRISKH